MPTFDAIATPSVRKAEHLEPAFVHARDVEIAEKLAYVEAFQLGLRSHLATYPRRSWA